MITVAALMYVSVCITFFRLIVNTGGSWPIAVIASAVWPIYLMHILVIILLPEKGDRG